jgi:hypothetical protein
VDSAAPLSAMVQVLTRHEFAFVRLLGQVGGVLARDDLQKPIGACGCSAWSPWPN